MADYANGVAAIVALLKANAALVALVPAAKITAGDVPLGTVSPAISVTQVSSVPYLTVSMREAGKTLHTDRVQVTAFVKASNATPAGPGYPGLRSVMRAIFLACPNTKATVGGVALDSIIPDAEGPDFSDGEIGVLSSSRDFFVRYTV